MALEASLAVPDRVTFEQAIALTQSLLDQFEPSHDSDSEALEQTVRALTQTENGARGFFVSYLSDTTLSDSQRAAAHPAIVRALHASPNHIASLLVKNLAMSTAMAIAHRRSQHEAMALGSDRVRSRTEHLIQALSLPQIQEQMRHLADSIDTGEGEYQTFLTRWGYDDEQRLTIRRSLEQAGQSRSDF